MSISEIKATSNTARAYFAAANLFKHPHTVIWEYVTNEIQLISGVERTETMIEVQ